jgi:hypothetical protein
MEKYRLENTALAGGHCDLSDVAITVSSSRETEKIMNKSLLVAW